MLLAVDVGNTQTSWGVFDDEKTLVRSGRIATSSTDTSAELLGAVSTTLPGDDAAEPPPDRAVIASVVPTLTGRWIDYCRSIGIEDITVVDSTTAGGLTILLDDPSEAGADRLANAVGVKMRFGAPAIVVDFGTATTIDVIDQNGAYRGGIISPGLQTSAAALFSHAARLSAIELTVPHNVIGSSTTTAVQSGLVYGEAAKVDGLVERALDEYQDEARSAGGDSLRPIVVATGGLAEMLAPLCSSIENVERDLTLFGLCEIAFSARCVARHPSDT